MSDIAFNVTDGRGSKDQKLLFNWLNILYPKSDIIYEQYIPDINLRIDLYIPDEKLAIEYHGRQHYEYIPFFHKSYTDFELSKTYDDKKLNYLLEHGITFIEIPYNHKLKNENDLLSLINSTPKSSYPFKPFLKNKIKTKVDTAVRKQINEEKKKKETEYKQTQEYLEKQEEIRNTRKEYYKKQKESYKNSEQYKLKQLELKELHKQRYQQFKKNK